MNANELFRRDIIGGPLRLIEPMKVFNAHLIPKNERIVFAGGPHETYKESLGFSSHLPDLEIHYLVKAELFEVPIVGWFLRTTGMIPTYRRVGRALDAIGPAVDDLKSGKGIAILVYPEGTRHAEDNKVHKGKSGAVRIALQADAWIVPFGQIGMKSSNPFASRAFVFGEPFKPSSFLTEDEKLLTPTQQEAILGSRVTEYLMETIAELANTEYVRE